MRLPLGVILVTILILSLFMPTLSWQTTGIGPMREFRYSTYGLSLEYPERWWEIERHSGDVNYNSCEIELVTLTSSLGRDDISVNIRVYDTDTASESLKEELDWQVDFMHSDDDVISYNTDAEIGARPAYDLKYMEQNGIPIVVHEIGTIVGTNVYYIQHRYAESEGPAVYSDRILNSIRVLHPPEITVQGYSSGTSPEIQNISYETQDVAHKNLHVECIGPKTPG